ncbi:MAG: DUF4350 domain-containing protein [Roseivirga sp.]|nr:DUF4350 domain-containing protein [Roseivirga sp.]
MKRILVILLLVPLSLWSQQVADPDFDYKVTPGFVEGERPLILIDEAHHNFHTREGRYAPFAKILQDYGFEVRSLTESVSSKELTEVAMLVISNPIHESDMGNWVLPNPSAFSTKEVKVLKKWVRQGGRLFLIADHMPFGGAAQAIGQAFGFQFGNGFARNPQVQGWDYFTKRDKSLLEHQITSEIDQIATFTGQAFTIPDKAEGLMRFAKGYISLRPDTAWRFNLETPAIDIEGQYQGAVLQYGKGKLAVFGEAAMFTTQLAGKQRFKVGMNAQGAEQNAPFLVNLLDWLFDQK